MFFFYSLFQFPLQLHDILVTADQEESISLLHALFVVFHEDFLMLQMTTLLLDLGWYLPTTLQWQDVAQGRFSVGYRTDRLKINIAQCMRPLLKWLYPL